jgi:hypothetical protein
MVASGRDTRKGVNMSKGKPHRDERYTRELAQQDQELALARELGSHLLQPVDDISPLPCTHADCTQQAIVALRLNAGTSGEQVMTACREHESALAAWALLT